MREAMTQAQGRYDSTSRTNKPTKMKTIELVISRDKIENNVRYNVADLIDPSFAGRGGESFTTLRDAVSYCKAHKVEYVRNKSWDIVDN
jgi:hypothetical protein